MICKLEQYLVFTHSMWMGLAGFIPCVQQDAVWSAYLRNGGPKIVRMRTSASGSTGLKKPKSPSYPRLFLVLLLDLLVPHRRVGQPRNKAVTGLLCLQMAFVNKIYNLIT
jgi:hypothetical protein